MKPLFQNALIAWRLGMRSHAMRALLVLGAILMLVSYMAGTFSLRQPQVVALDMGLSGLRFLGLLLVLFWMQEAFAKDIDKRTITFALAYPVPRSVYVIGRFAGVMALVMLTVAIWGSLLYLVNLLSGWEHAQASRASFGWAYLLVLAGVALDLMVIGAFFVAMVSISETPMLPFLASFGFALAARSFGVMLDYLALSKMADAGLKESVLPWLERLRWILPDLSRLDWRQISLFNHWPAPEHLVQGAAVAVGYLILMLTLAVTAYRRRDFS